MRIGGLPAAERETGLPTAAQPGRILRLQQLLHVLLEGHIHCRQGRAGGRGAMRAPPREGPARRWGGRGGGGCGAQPLLSPLR